MSEEQSDRPNPMRAAFEFAAEESVNLDPSEQSTAVERRARTPLAVIVSLTALFLGGSGWFSWSRALHREGRAEAKRGIPERDAGNTETTAATKPLEPIAGGKGRAVVFPLDPDAPAVELPPEFDGVISASLAPYWGKPVIRFVRSDGSGWDFDPASDSLTHRLNGVKAMAVDTSRIWLGEDGELIRYGSRIRKEQDSPPAGPFSVLEPGTGVLYGIRPSGELVAWPKPGKAEHEMVRIPRGLGPVEQVSAGNSHVIVRTRDGEIVSWGADVEGSTRVPDFGEREVVSVGAFLNASVAILDDGRVRIWGGGGGPELGERLDEIEDAEEVFTGSAGDQGLAIRRRGGRWFVWVGAKENARSLPESLLRRLDGCDAVALGGRYAVGLRRVENFRPAHSGAASSFEFERREPPQKQK